MGTRLVQCHFSPINVRLLYLVLIERHRFSKVQCQVVVPRLIERHSLRVILDFVDCR